MAERGAGRKRPREQPLQQQQQSKPLTPERVGGAQLPSESANGHKRVAARTADASSQTSPPASPRASGDDAVDLSSLLLLPSAHEQSSIDCTGDWLAWVQLSGFTQSNTPAAAAAAESAASATTAAVAIGSAAVSSAALTRSLPSPLPAAYHSSLLSSPAFPLRATESAGGSSPYTASSPPRRLAASESGRNASGQPSSEGEAARRASEERVDTLHAVAVAVAPSTASMSHLRPSSAVVLPLSGLHAPLVDTHRRLLQAPHSALAQRPPLLLPWMNKQAAASSASRSHTS